MNDENDENRIISKKAERSRKKPKTANWLRCNALRAGWLHSRGAGGAMLFSYAIEGFLGWEERV